MNKLSVVIICHNEEYTIESCIISAKLLSDDVVVVDSFSTDNTPEICQKHSVNFVQQKWLGYGAQKNHGNQLAKNDWILSLDADEVLTIALVEEIKTLVLNDDKIVYKINRQNHFGNKKINFGGLSRDYVRRIFNRKKVKWNTSAVHEDLMIKNKKNIKPLSNRMKHYSIKSLQQYEQKSLQYASLFAQQKQTEGKKATLLKRFGSPLFKFVKEYLFMLGFLDGALGWKIATIGYQETYTKYKLLHNLNQENQSPK